MTVLRLPLEHRAVAVDRMASQLLERSRGLLKALQQERKRPRASARGSKK